MGKAPGDDHAPVERLAQALDRVAAELRELVEEQHPVVGEGSRMSPWGDPGEPHGSLTPFVEGLRRLEAATEHARTAPSRRFAGTVAR